MGKIIQRITECLTEKWGRRSYDDEAPWKNPCYPCTGIHFFSVEKVNPVPLRAIQGNPDPKTDS